MHQRNGLIDKEHGYNNNDVHHFLCKVSSNNGINVLPGKPIVVWPHRNVITMQEFLLDATWERSCGKHTCAEDQDKSHLPVRGFQLTQGVQPAG